MSSYSLRGEKTQRAECKRDIWNIYGVTAFGVDTVLNESNNWSLCIYVALHVTAAGLEAETVKTNSRNKAKRKTV